MTALVALLLTAAPTALVLADSEDAAPAADQVVVALARAGVSARLTTAGRTCLKLDERPRTECLADLAQIEWVDAILTVQGAALDGKRSAYVETTMRRTRKPLGPISAMSAPDAFEAVLAKSLAPAVAAIKAASRPVAPASPAPTARPDAPDPRGPEVDAAFATHDVPLAPKPAPEVADAPVLVVPVAAQPTRTAAWVTTGVGAAAVVAGVSFGAMSLGERGRLQAADPGTRISPLTYQQARGLRDDANLHQAAALAAGAAGLAALGVAIYLWSH